MAVGGSVEPTAATGAEQGRHAGSGAGQSAALRRVAIIGPSALQLKRLRGDLVASIAARKHAVACYAPEFTADDIAAYAKIGVDARALPPEAPGFVLLPQRRFVRELATDLDSWRPHVVVAFGRDMTALAVRAARRARVPRIAAMLNDLPEKPPASLQRTLNLADLAIFHNADDAKTLKRAGVLPDDLAFTVVGGSGIDLVRYPAVPLPPLNAGLVFLMIARLDAAKGVRTYCEAARLAKAKAPNATFHLAGEPGRGPSAISEAEIASFGDCVSYLGPVADVRPLLAASHVYVFPSRAEGMPRSVLEALATGRPVITSNVAGCRDTVDERINGCLVPPADPAALALAFESFLKRPDLIASLARASRAKAERRFDVRQVNEALLDVLGL